MKLIETFTSSKIASLIFDAKERLFLSLPGIDAEVADALLFNKNNIVIKIAIDNSEEAIRNGFGDLSSLEELHFQDFQIYQCEGNLVSFIISDDNGYFIFPHSKIFSDEPKGPNSFKLDPVTIQLLIQNYFPDNKKSENIDFTQAATIGDSIKYFENELKELTQSGSAISTSIFDEQKFELIKKNLEQNPPLPPDLKRLIDTYNAEVQFAELSFVGSGIQSLTIHYPKKALQVSSDELKQMLSSSMKLFGDLKSNPAFSKLNLLQLKVDRLQARVFNSN